MPGAAGERGERHEASWLRPPFSAVTCVKSSRRQQSLHAGVLGVNAMTHGSVVARLYVAFLPSSVSSMPAPVPNVMQNDMPIWQSPCRLLPLGCLHGYLATGEDRPPVLHKRLRVPCFMPQARAEAPSSILHPHTQASHSSLWQQCAVRSNRISASRETSR